MEAFLSRIDPQWNEFWSKLYQTKKYEYIMKIIMICPECCVFFSFGKNDDDLLDVYEFSDYGGEKISFYSYLYRDSEG